MKRSRLTSLLTKALFVVDAMLLLTAAWMHYDLRRDPLIGHKLPEFVSWHYDGTANAPLNGPCRIIRFTSNECHFCAAQFSSGWLQAERIAADHGCQSVVLSPYGLGEPPVGDSVSRQIVKTVSLESADATHLQRTPTTLVTDLSGRIKWVREGVLSPADLRVLNATFGGL